MDPLSITTSILGILTAAVQVTAVLGKIKDAPKSIEDILIETEHIKLVFRALQTFIDRAYTVPRERAALIQLDDVVAILTRTVIVFSELEPIITKISSQKRPSSLRLLTWMRLESGVVRLVNQLQRHKASLTLLLQIIQCESDLEARETAERLHQHMEQEMEINPDLSQRLGSLQLQADTMQHENLGGQNASSDRRSQDSDSRSDTPVQTILPTQVTLICSHQEGNSEASHSDFSAEESFNAVLAPTRVYNRVQNREIDMITPVSTTRSRAWSILSGLSLSQISTIAVIKLPIHAPELTQFKQLVSPPLATFSRPRPFASPRNRYLPDSVFLTAPKPRRSYRIFP